LDYADYFEDRVSPLSLHFGENCFRVHRRPKLSTTNFRRPNRISQLRPSKIPVPVPNPIVDEHHEVIGLANADNTSSGDTFLSHTGLYCEINLFVLVISSRNEYITCIDVY
jgi:hypothetical protein